MTERGKKVLKGLGIAAMAIVFWPWFIMKVWRNWSTAGSIQNWLLTYWYLLAFPVIALAMLLGIMIQRQFAKRKGRRR